MYGMYCHPFDNSSSPFFKYQNALGKPTNPTPLDPIRLRDMQPAPNSPRSLARAHDRLRRALQRHDLRARRVEQELHLLVDLVRVESLQRDDLVPVVHCPDTTMSRGVHVDRQTDGKGTERTIEPPDHRRSRRAVPHHHLDMLVRAREPLHIRADVPAQVRRGRPRLAVLEDELADLGG